MEFSHIEVLVQLSQLNVYKAAGPDKIPAIILKQCRNVLCKPLSILFNKSITSSELPQDWKDADILPIFKSGDKQDCGNYRPISLTSIVVKILEKLILSLPRKKENYWTNPSMDFESTKAVKSSYYCTQRTWQKVLICEYQCTPFI